MSAQLSQQVQRRAIALPEIQSGALGIIRLLQAHGFKALLAGGAIRDLLIGRRPKDYDLVTDASLSDLQALFSEVRTSGTRFQIAVITIDREHVEVACFRRSDGSLYTRDDERVDGSPTLEQLLSEDSASRDFTMNALYYDPLAQVVYDQHGGLADIQEKTVRFLEHPAVGIQRNPLTMLRAIRFAHALDFEIDSETRSVIRQHGAALHAISAERILIELGKHLGAGHARASIGSMKEYGLFEQIFGTIGSVEDAGRSPGFLDIALTSIDEASSAGAVFSHAFLFAVLLWPALQAKRTVPITKKSALQGELAKSAQAVLQQHGRRLELHERLGSQILAIWSTQPVFEKTPSAASVSFMQQPQFRAGLNFLFIRCFAGDLPKESGEQWEKMAAC